MYKKTVSGMMLILLLIGLFSLAINVRPAKGAWTGTVYIRADGSIDPPDAPIITCDNATYTLTDDIISLSNGIIVERSNIVIDGANQKIEGPATYESTGISLIGITNVTIKNINIIKFGDGILLNNCSKNRIFGNNIIAIKDGISLNNSSTNLIYKNNISVLDYGIRLSYFSSNNRISQNVIRSSWFSGIGVFGFSNSNVINANNVVDSYEGIRLMHSSNNTISGNNITNNRYGIWFSHSTNNTVIGNNITANDYDGIVLCDSSTNNIISKNTIAANNGFGILLDYSSSNSIRENSIMANNWDGISLHCSFKNIISGNSIMANDLFGIGLIDSSNNEVIGNNLTNNECGIGLVDSLYNNISNNRINNFGVKDGIYSIDSGVNFIVHNDINNCKNGILLSNSNYTSIIGNKITHSYSKGIYLFSSFGNEFFDNYLFSNKIGILLNESLENRIYHNNFINNEIQAEILSSPFNDWDDGYPSGGNYWSDYTGVDLYSGPFQNETGSDGIGDTPYIIDSHNIDRYPLMNPLGEIPAPVPSVINATVDIDPKALNLRSRGKWITAYIELPEGYDVGNINVTSIMLNDTIPVYLMDVPAPKPVPTVIGDHDDDGILDLMVKFDRAELTSYILTNVDIIKFFEERFMTITLTLTGKLNDGTPFQGSITITVIMPILICGRHGIYPI